MDTDSQNKTNAQIETEFQSSWTLLPKFADTDVFQKLIDNEFKDPLDINAQAVQVIRRLLDYCGKKIPYYQQQFGSSGLKLNDFLELADLEKLPILTRFDLVKQFDKLHPSSVDPNSGKVHMTRTTGSTGLPVSVLHSRESMSNFPILWQRLARWYRLDLEKRFARIRFAPDLFKLEGNRLNPDGNTVGRPCWIHSGQFFKTGDEVHFNVSNPRPAQLQWLDQFRPAYLLSYPGLLEELALANDCKPIPAVESLLAVSSILTSSMRSRIEQAFGLPIYQSYGLNEVGLVATQCAAGRYHVNTEHAHVEIVDQEGLSVSEGSSGRLLVTSLTNSAMPLLRYDSGDLATASVGPCSCGRTQPSFENILGRYIRFAGTPEGTRPHLNGLLKELSSMPNELFANIRQYQMHQLPTKDFQMHIVADGPLHAEFYKRLQEKWSGLNTVSEKWKFSILLVDHIEATPSGKQLDFVSAFHELDPDFK